ncbi:MAG: LptF/LptG family permease [Spirochaetota bacterium]
MKVRATTLKLYIFREYALSFFIAFLFFFFIFFVNQMLVVARSILLKNVSLVDMLLILLYSVPIILAYTFPFSALTGATMALGDLASRNEILAMRTSGISYRQILTPILVFSILLTGLSFILNDVLLPMGTIKYKQLYRELLYENPGLDLSPYSIERFNNLIFITGDVENGHISELTVIDTSSSKVQVLAGTNARLRSDDGSQQDLVLDLNTMRGIKPEGPGADEFHFFTAEQMNYYLSMDQITFNLLSVAPNEKSLRDLYSDIQEKKQELDARGVRLAERIDEQRFSLIHDYYEQGFFQQDKSIQGSYQRLLDMEEQSIFSRTLQHYLLEFYKKTALPFACLFLVFFAFPFSLIQLKNGRLVGFSIGMVTSIAYWFMLFGGQTLGARTTYSPFLLMWLPNVLLFAIGLTALLVRIRR